MRLTLPRPALTGRSLAGIDRLAHSSICVPHVTNGSIELGSGRKIPLREIDHIALLGNGTTLVCWGEGNKERLRVPREELQALLREWTDAGIAEVAERGVLRTAPAPGLPWWTGWALVVLVPLNGLVAILKVEAFSSTRAALIAFGAGVLLGLLAAAPLVFLLGPRWLASLRARRLWTRLELTPLGIAGWDRDGRCFERPWCSIRVVEGVVRVGERRLDPFTMKHGPLVAGLAYRLASVEEPRPRRAWGLWLASVVLVITIVSGPLVESLTALLLGLSITYLASIHGAVAWLAGRARRRTHKAVVDRLPAFDGVGWFDAPDAPASMLAGS